MVSAVSESSSPSLARSPAGRVADSRAWLVQMDQALMANMRALNAQSGWRTGDGQAVPGGGAEATIGKPTPPSRRAEDASAAGARSTSGPTTWTGTSGLLPVMPPDLAAMLHKRSDQSMGTLAIPAIGSLGLPAAGRPQGRPAGGSHSFFPNQPQPLPQGDPQRRMVHVACRSDGMEVTVRDASLRPWQTSALLAEVGAGARAQGLLVRSLRLNGQQVYQMRDDPANDRHQAEAPDRPAHFSPTLRKEDTWQRNPYQA